MASGDTSVPVDEEVDDRSPKRAFPSALTILVGVGIGLWFLAFFIPAGTYQLDDDGSPIPGSFTELPRPLGFGEKLTTLLAAPLNGLYGIQDPATGTVGPYNSGILFGSAQVFGFIVAIGAFMTVVLRTGALTLAISHLAERYRTRGFILIIALSLVFGFLGSVKSWGDETIGMYAILLPLLVGLGYDRLVVVAVVSVAPFAGSIGSIFNPFRIGVGSDAADVDIVDGAPLRIIIFVVTMAVVVAFILRYGQAVKADPTKSMIGFDDDDRRIFAEGSDRQLEPLTTRSKVVVGLVIATFALMVYSLVPWSALLGRTTIDPYTNTEVQKVFAWDLGWWMPELSAMFIVMAVVVAIAARLGEPATSAAIIDGIKDFAGPAVLVVVARGVAVILTNTKTLDTILNAMERIVGGSPQVAFVFLFSLISIPLSFLVGSGSAGMALVMPVLAPLGDFVDVDRSLIITMYNSIGGWVLLVAPTNALLMAGLVLARVPYNRYVRFMVPLLGALFVVLVVLFLVGLVL